MKYTLEYINEVKQAASIEEVIGSFITLKRDGDKFKANCPFHDEKTASFLVNPKEGYYKCFGCGKAGDAFKFVGEYNRMNFPESVKWVAERFGVALPDGEKPAKKAPKIQSRPAKADEKTGQASFIYNAEISENELRMFFSASYWPKTNDEEVGIYYTKKLNEQTERMRKVMALYNWHTASEFTHISKERKAITYTATEDCPIFVRDEGEFQKIYMPANTGVRFFYAGKKPRTYIVGLTQLTKKYQEELEKISDLSDESEDAEKARKNFKLDGVILAAGERDAMNMAMMGYSVIWRNSEQEKISSKNLTQIFTMCHNFWNAPNIDDTGLREMHKLCMTEDDIRFLDIRNIMLPMGLLKFRDGKGKPCKDVKDYLDHFRAKDFQKLVNTAIPYRFWDVYYSKDAEKFSVNKKALYNFIFRNGYSRLEAPEEKTGYRFIYTEDHIVKAIDGDKIRSFVKEFLDSRHVDTRIENMMMNNPVLSDSSLENLPYTKPDFKTFDPFSQYFFFTDEIWHVTAEEIYKTRTSAAKLHKSVWEDKVLRPSIFKYENTRINLEEPAPFSYNIDPETNEVNITINDKENVFLQYLWNTSRVHWRKEKEGLTEEQQKEHILHLGNKLFAYGYLLCRYKQESAAWWVYAMEHNLTPENESHGGTGKSIFFKSLYNLKNVEFINGRDRKQIDGNHTFENVTLHTDIIFFDELDKYFPFDRFFSEVTSVLTVNPKGVKKFNIPFEDSPKICSASNYPLHRTDPSTNRRLLYIVFSDYYHGENPDTDEEVFSPRIEFGYDLFSINMPEEQWNKFYNLAARATQFYLDYVRKLGALKPPMENVQTKTMMSMITETFINWADVILSPEGVLLNSLVWRHELYNSFLSETRSKFTPPRFKKSLMLWCKMRGYILNPTDISTDGRIVKQHPDLNKTAECFYIQTMDNEGNWKELNVSVIRSVQTQNNYGYCRPEKPDEGGGEDSQGQTPDPAWFES